MFEDGNPTETPNQEALVADCLKTVEDYRGENISKWEAVSQIFGAIWSTTASADSQQRSAAGDTYLAMLTKEHKSTTVLNVSNNMQAKTQNLPVSRATLKRTTIVGILAI